MSSRATYEQAESARFAAAVKLWGGVIGAIVAFVVVTWFAFATVEIIEEGNVGLVTRQGRAQEVRPPGLTFINPFTQRVIEFETRTRPLNFEKIEAGSAETQRVILTGKLNYNVAGDTETVINLYRTVGLDYQGRILTSALNTVSKATTATYPVNDILPNRAVIEQRVVTTLNERLKEYGITVTDLFLDDISFSKEYQDAVEKKQAEAQKAEAEKQITLQKAEQANQAIEQARGQAESARLLSERLTAEVIQNKAVEKWDGKLPTTLVTGENGAMPFIDVGAR